MSTDHEAAAKRLWWGIRGGEIDTIAEVVALLESTERETVERCADRAAKYWPARRQWWLELFAESKRKKPSERVTCHSCGNLVWLQADGSLFPHSNGRAGGICTESKPTQEKR